MNTSEAMNLAGATGTISDHPCVDMRASRLVLFCYACACCVDPLKDYHDCPVAGPGLPTWWGEPGAWVVC